MDNFTIYLEILIKDNIVYSPLQEEFKILVIVQNPHQKVIVHWLKNNETEQGAGRAMCVWCKAKKNSETWAGSREEALRKQKLIRESRFLEKRKKGLRTSTGRVERCENTQGAGEVWELNMDGKTKRKGLGFISGVWLMLWHWNSSCFREKLKTFYGPNLPGFLQLVEKGNWTGYKFKMAFGDGLVFPMWAFLMVCTFFQIAN